MFSTPSKNPAKRPRHEEPVFRTPMTYTPRLVNNRPTPTPSRNDTLRRQLGLDDDPGTSHSDSSPSEEEGEGKENKKGTHFEREVCKLREELEQREKERDDLRFNIKSLKDKSKLYKRRLEKEESTKKIQLKSLRKTHDVQIKEKDNFIQSLQSIVEEQENKILELENRLHGNTEEYSSSPSGGHLKLIEEVKRLQNEKNEIQSKYINTQSDLEICQKLHGNDHEDLKEKNAKLEEENEDLKERVATLLNYHEGSEEMSPCFTDTEKHLEKVEEENKKLKVDNKKLTDELAICQKNSVSDLGSPLTKYNREIKGYLMEDKERMREKINVLEKELEAKCKYLVECDNKHRRELMSMQSDNQQSSKQIRDLNAKLMALQARSPEVVTKIEKVRLEVDSEDTKMELHKQKQVNKLLESQLEDLQKNSDDTEAKLGEAQHHNTELLHKYQMLTKDRESEKLRFLEEFERLEKEKEDHIKIVSDAMENKMKDIQNKYKLMCDRVSSVNKVLAEVACSYLTLRKEARSFPRILKETVDNVKREIVRAICDISKYNQELICKYQKEMKLRKKYHNELVELKGNIRVFCRVRPIIKEDGGGSPAEVVVSYDKDDDSLVHINNKGRTQSFELDKVFTDKSTQKEVFEEVRALSTSCIDGFNVCIFAYGQTGSGKTYTMEGLNDDPGINQRALHELFKETQERSADWQYSISVRVVEIYNEVIRDLLSDDPSNKMEVKMNPEGGYHVPGLVSIPVSSVQEVNQVFSIGQRNRATAITNMNEHSSRSHALLCITVTGVNKTTGTKTIGKLNLVDLAGSERVSKSGADGARLKEAQNINKSLACLGDVIHALRNKQGHIPYRNSKLTFLLQDSLGGDSKTLMIVQVAPVDKNVGETVCSLNFGLRVRTVELGAASRRIENCDIEPNCNNLFDSPGKHLKANTPNSKAASPSMRSTTPLRFGRRK